MRTNPSPFYLTHSKLRAGLLSLFFLNPQSSYYLRELGRLLKASPGALARELKSLTREGLLLRVMGKGKVIFYRINPRYLLFNEIKSMIEKSRGGVKSPASVEKGRKSSVYIVAGPNGSGKTTFAKKFLPDYAHCKQFVNADLIAGGIAPFSPEGSAIQAGKLLLGQIRSFSRKGIDFGFETTLAGKSYRNLLADLRNEGYKLHLFFLWIPTLEMALSRIEDRVKRGGHSIPKPVVARRFGRGIRHLFELYRPLLDLWCLFDNSGSFPHLIATGMASDLKVLDQPLFDKIKKQAGVDIR